MKQHHSIETVFIIMVAAFTLAGCQAIWEESKIVQGSGKVITQARQVGNFTQVENTTSANVILSQGQPLALAIEGDDNLLEVYLTEISGERLTIKTKPNTSIHSKNGITVYITLPQLTSIRVTGSGDVEMDRWIGDGSVLETTGSGNITVTSLVAGTLTARLSGSGELRVDGKAENLVVKGSGSGDFDGGNFQVNTLDATLSGSGDARAWVIETLVGSLSGSGNVEYYGSPKVTERASGSGKVERLGEAP